MHGGNFPSVRAALGATVNHQGDETQGTGRQGAAWLRQKVLLM